ncbi:hypothetical protein, partial [Bradyrhizobium sp. SZCCHNR1051]|uniref:hypothetical protein n=1 Tax=Bradyrhizobium sp. SZCCHNR1051 TaxID=3057355 RepID=UPI0029171373
YRLERHLPEGTFTLSRTAPFHGAPYIVLFSVHRAFWPPSSLGSSPKQLSISVGMPEPHDFTSALAAFVSRRKNVHRIPASRVVTIARNAPLVEAGCVH